MLFMYQFPIEDVYLDRQLSQEVVKNLTSLENDLDFRIDIGARGKV